MILSLYDKTAIKIIIQIHKYIVNKTPLDKLVGVLFGIKGKNFRLLFWLAASQN